VQSRKSKRHKNIVRHIPLNSEALFAIEIWHKQCGDKHGSIFINEETGKSYTTVKKAWNSLRDEAELKNFRWHDFRHHFASSLVMAGVDLNTVRELLGHSSTKMTLRYAHLAPKHKADAVEKLIRQ
jgi:integrase